MGKIETKGVWSSVSVDPSTFHGLGGNHIRWGDVPDAKRSGYLFRGRTPEADLDGTEFVLGTLTHYNFRIPMSQPDEFDVFLDIVVTFQDDGTKVDLPALRFHHHETPNVGGDVDDVVHLPKIDRHPVVKIGGESYRVNITGFTTDSERHAEWFVSPEGKSSSGQIKAQFARVGEPNSYISHVQVGSDPSSPRADDYVEILNGGAEPADISGWKLRADDAGHEFTFPTGATIQPGRRVRVYTDTVHRQYGGYSYGVGSPVWNHEGDTALLEDADGNTVSVLPFDR
ncbi:lamin tail domain-containing protein [Streptomyces sp. B1866]|uniref:lamin tail domain-containing protein n=1 Tax=Streptomyces sp. B1866 TaxID=3075431 RepID=UPI002890A5F1|nr:lamin tail domain-containing protein [Streptomyces sp. B1866]MDT3397362.1 lamin tail domain-containing protein [Streptomyces sp. B1866]